MNRFSTSERIVCNFKSGSCFSDRKAALTEVDESFLSHSRLVSHRYTVGVYHRTVFRATAFVEWTIVAIVSREASVEA